MFTSQIVGAITPFSGTTTADKNGEGAVMIQCIAGRMPARNVISGTVAQRSGFEVGKTYLINIREAGHHEVHGMQYDFIKIKELSSGSDIVDTCLKLGDPIVFNVGKPEVSKEYERKSDKVIGLRTVEAQKGIFKPANGQIVTNSDTAKVVKEGSSVDHETLRNEQDILNKNKAA